MGMFDDCIPLQDIRCPIDGHLIGEGTWQTKATACLLKEITLGDDMRQYELFTADGWFEMHEHCGNDPYHWCEAAGIINNHIWVATLLTDVALGGGDDTCLWNIRSIDDRFRIR